MNSDAPGGSMALTVLLPTRIVLREHVTKIVAEGLHGSFCLLPRHMDFAAALVPGIVSLWPVGGKEVFLAVDQGVLVKTGSKVAISVRNAISGVDLEDLRRVVEEEFVRVDEQEQLNRSAVARIEAGVVRWFMETQKGRHG